MRLEDAGNEKSLSRAKRSSSVIQSMLKRVSDEKMFITIVATYSGVRGGDTREFTLRGPCAPDRVRATAAEPARIERWRI